MVSSVQHTLLSLNTPFAYLGQISLSYSPGKLVKLVLKLDKEDDVHHFPVELLID